jgi:hypothetical protein
LVIEFRQDPNCFENKSVCHAAELTFLWNTIGFYPGFAHTPPELRLGREMMRSWSSFAHGTHFTVDWIINMEREEQGPLRRKKKALGLLGRRGLFGGGRGALGFLRRGLFGGGRGALGFNLLFWEMGESRSFYLPDFLLFTLFASKCSHDDRSTRNYGLALV